jgi:hypothetical protein
MDDKSSSQLPELTIALNDENKRLLKIFEDKQTALVKLSNDVRDA